MDADAQLSAVGTVEHNLGVNVISTHTLQGRTYKIESKIDSSARKEVVLDVLTDYPNHSEVFSSIHSSRVVVRREHEAEVLQVHL